MSAADFANGQRLSENESVRRTAYREPAVGFRYAAAYAGIRAAEKDDLALIVSGMPAVAAAVFTQNRVQAAPVQLSPPASAGSRVEWRARSWSTPATPTAPRAPATRSRSPRRRRPRNCCVCQPAQVLPASTGVIGVELDAREDHSRAARTGRHVSLEPRSTTCRARS